MSLKIKNRKDIIELYERLQIVEERLELYKNNYNEDTDKLNKMLFEIEYKILYKKFQNKNWKKIISNLSV